MRENFIEICEAVGVSDWQAIACGDPIRELDVPDRPLGNRTVQLDWGEAPEIVSFYGRTAELAQLEQWIVGERCKVVCLLGMGGIGKTSLAVTLADQMSDRFDYLIWRSLYNAPPIEDILADLIRFLSDQQGTHLSEDLDSQLSQLMDYLRTRRCLVVLDNAESILSDEAARVGCYRSGYSGYGELIRRIGVERHQSCLLLTSREELAEITQLKGPKVCSLKLPGLSQAEGQSIFQ